MYKQNHFYLQSDLEKRYEKKAKQKKKKMKISGAGVKKLQKIIIGG